jgi:hypothetical protein
MVLFGYFSVRSVKTAAFPTESEPGTSKMIARRVTTLPADSYTRHP